MGRNTAKKPKAIWRGATLDEPAPLPPGEPYPLPRYAASIWHNGRGLVLCLPGANGAQRGHTIYIDDDKLTLSDGAAYAGWATLRTILTERHRATYAQAIGTKAAPSQYNLEAMLRVMAGSTPKVRRFDERGARTTSLADLGLDDE